MLVLPDFLEKYVLNRKIVSINKNDNNYRLEMILENLDSDNTEPTRITVSGTMIIKENGKTAVAVDPNRRWFTEDGKPKMPESFLSFEGKALIDFSYNSYNDISLFFEYELSLEVPAFDMQSYKLKNIHLKQEPHVALKNTSSNFRFFATHCQIGRGEE